MVLATVQFLTGVKEEISEIKLRQGKESGKRIIVFIFEKLRAMEKLRSFSAGAECMLLTDEEGDIRVTPRSVEFFFKNDDDLARMECSFEIVNTSEWQRLRRFMDRYAESNGMGYEGGTAPQSDKME
ncbi:MAG: photosystem II reaction center protein Psb28 [Gemmatimonadaceae bacterium]|nr:photosystem II reaction center protein Psb28 [Gloeobacterales cyanobacterium ES-bin-141]